MKLHIDVPITNDEVVFKKSLEIPKYNNILETFQFYNEYIEVFRIDILMVYTEGKYESFSDWYKLREPKYVLKGKTLIIETFLTNSLLNTFVNANHNDDYKILSNLILETIADVELPKKVKDFDKEKFKMNVENFFKKEGII